MDSRKKILESSIIKIRKQLDILRDAGYIVCDRDGAIVIFDSKTKPEVGSPEYADKLKWKIVGLIQHA